MPQFYDRVGINRRKRFSAVFFKRCRDAKKVSYHEGAIKGFLVYLQGRDDGLLTHEKPSDHCSSNSMMRTVWSGVGEVVPRSELLRCFLALAEKLTRASLLLQAVL